MFDCVCARTYLCVCARALTCACLCVRAHSRAKAGGSVREYVYGVCASVCVLMNVTHFVSIQRAPITRTPSQNHTTPLPPTRTHTFAGGGASWLDTVLESTQILWYLPKHSSIYLICATSIENERQREFIRNYSRMCVRFIWRLLGAMVGAGRGWSLSFPPFLPHSLLPCLPSSLPRAAR